MSSTYHRPVGYFEQIRQIEETADQILQVDGPVAYLVTSNSYDTTLAAALAELADQAGSERAQIRASADQALGILVARKRLYSLRKPTIICMISATRLIRLLEGGLVGTAILTERVRRQCRQVAAAEALNIAALMEAEPMGLQFGLLTGTEPSGSFKILRARDRATLAVNPFPSDAIPGTPTGVAMITAADEAIAAHQRVAEGLWKELDERRRRRRQNARDRRGAPDILRSASPQVSRPRPGAAPAYCAHQQRRSRPGRGDRKRRRH